MQKNTNYFCYMKILIKLIKCTSNNIYLKKIKISIRKKEYSYFQI